LTQPAAVACHITSGHAKSGKTSQSIHAPDSSLALGMTEWVLGIAEKAFGMTGTGARNAERYLRSDVQQLQLPTIWPLQQAVPPRVSLTGRSITTFTDK
jgi:hypothetical protein